ncbi:hypothetical protein GJAV_G00206380 [Gymnothorax javanicus]|nr:hypothetical protein GJAV_G00206380 [Gymnothorax javanicus]
MAHRGRESVVSEAQTAPPPKQDKPSLSSKSTRYSSKGCCCMLFRLVFKGSGFDSYYDQKEYIGRSMHYWKVVLPLLEKVKTRRSIPEPLDPLFMHFASKDLQISEVKGLEEEVKIAFAALLDIEGKTEEAIATLENINSISASWHLTQMSQQLSEQAGNGVEENQDRRITFLKKFQKYLLKIYNAKADELDKLSTSMEVIMDLLNDVNQQLGESGRDMDEEEEGQSAHSSPNKFVEPGAPTSYIRFSTPSPTKNALSPSKRHIVRHQCVPPPRGHSGLFPAISPSPA